VGGNAAEVRLAPVSAINDVSSARDAAAQQNVQAAPVPETVHANAAQSSASVNAVSPSAGAQQQAAAVEQLPQPASLAAVTQRSLVARGVSEPGPITLERSVSVDTTAAPQRQSGIMLVAIGICLVASAGTLMLLYRRKRARNR
jgi:hypothetical protein